MLKFRHGLKLQKTYCSFTTRKVHTIGLSSYNISETDKPITVYEALEYKDLEKNLKTKGRFGDAILVSQMKNKYFKLYPFFLQSKVSPASFIMRMQLFAEADVLKLDIITMGGMLEVFIEVKYIMPITPYDYWNASWKLYFKPASFLDMEMVYSHIGTKEMFIFDKYGKWSKQGVAHPSLSLEKTYNEINWFEEFFPTFV